MLDSRNLLFGKSKYLLVFNYYSFFQLLKYALSINRFPALPSQS